MSARGPCSDTLSRIPASSDRMYAIIGMPKAAVFPEPVSAIPIMSRLPMPIGIAFKHKRRNERGDVGFALNLAFSRDRGGGRGCS